MAMTFREMNLRVFQRKPIPHVLWQPRMEPWLSYHKDFDNVPAQFQGMSAYEFYDVCDSSMRYVDYFTGAPSPVIEDFSSNVTTHYVQNETDAIRVYETPYGDLVETLRITPDKTWREMSFPVKRPSDLKALRWLYSKAHITFSPERFKQGAEALGERGVPQFYIPKSPYQALAQMWMKLPDLIYALTDSPQEVTDTMRAIDDAYDGLYEGMCSSGVVQIINFGENIHEALLSPRWFGEYLMPWYEKRAGQLHQAGIYSHMHLDGYFKTLLPYLAKMPFDGIEALTPVPQGDCTLEEIKEHIGDKILLDGVPAVMFLEMFPREELMKMTERVVELFHPNLVLGASDEVPEGAPEEAIERVKMVAAWCRTHGKG